MMAKAIQASLFDDALAPPANGTGHEAAAAAESYVLTAESGAFKVSGGSIKESLWEQTGEPPTSKVVEAVGSASGTSRASAKATMHVDLKPSLIDWSEFAAHAEREGSTRPPALGWPLLAIFCPRHQLDEVFGDLEERYRRYLAERGKLSAQIFFWGQVFDQFIRFGAALAARGLTLQAAVALIKRISGA
jgi:hypothetical protein